VLTLDSWWADRTLADVTGKTCRGYVEYRCSQPWRNAKPECSGKPARMVTVAAARRELADLRAAINHYHAEGFCRELIAVVLPARRLPVCCGPHGACAKGIEVTRAAVMWADTLPGSAICGAAIMPTIGRGYVDVERGLFYRRAAGERETKKRKPPVPVPPRLLAHLRRWQRLGIARKAIVEWNGEPVASVRRAFRSAAQTARLERVTPHTLRHSAATWLMQKGVNIWTAAGLLGMTPETLQRVYGHHHPDYMRAAADAIGRQNGDRLTVNKQRQTQSSVTKITEKSKAAR
jgi:Phage integrase family